MAYDPNDLRPTVGGDVAGAALWLLLLVGLSFTAGTGTAAAPTDPPALAACGPAAPGAHTARIVL